MTVKPFERVLIANRGEIAVRVIRGCHERGIEAVAVYSEADAAALHVRLADDAYPIGPAPSSESYLRADVLLRIAARAGCDAVHPGYGFLSESAAFAGAVSDAGLVWIGPPPGAISSMGSKTAARRLMTEAGVPVVPGAIDPITSSAEAARIVAEIGLPVMIKAAAGGGGKGMRAVFDADEIATALAAAQSEATKSFGDGSVYVEKLVVQPRHVEIQILADAHGNVVHLFERDCSIQRRHQKVVEETPCPVLPGATRAAMCAAAVEAARAVDYVGAGTVEFLYDPASDAFYFLEMNTRLQVEHPITEVVTGVDLVHAQLRVAAGEPLWFTQDTVAQRGHAIECRIYAEDATAGFRPSPGPLRGYREPSGAWVRVDSGVVEGMEIPIHYDPMIAKLVVWGPDRDTAIARCARALREYHIVGIPTSIPFFLALFDDPGFRQGRYDTSFITPEWLEENLGEPSVPPELAMAAAVARFEADRRALRAPGAGPGGSDSGGSDSGGSDWRRIHRWRTMKGVWR
ncbi:MAG TPA: acetyl-CoA carboxylase biotin carboxylase subunit [Deltaproteobacteria bacterium]|nr:acetyl-CoA carboxylase biotin carboxylase subunit [Deltaproteobacteria bacterium]